MKKKCLIIMFMILVLPLVNAAVEVQYSDDNETWKDVTNIDESVCEAYQVNLQVGTEYFFRAKNSTTDWAYTSQRTEFEAERNLLTELIGIVSILALFIVFTIWSAKNEHFGLAHFFFVGTFIFATVISNLMWRIAYDNGETYAGLALGIYRVMLIITMLIFFYILVLATVNAVQVRRIKGNPIDHYQDNLNQNGKN